MSYNQTPSWGVFVYSERQTGYGTVRSEETVPAPSLEQAQKWASQWASIPSEDGGGDYVETTVVQLEHSSEG